MHFHCEGWFHILCVCMSSVTSKEDSTETATTSYITNTKIQMLFTTFIEAIIIDKLSALLLEITLQMVH